MKLHRRLVNVLILSAVLLSAAGGLSNRRAPGFCLPDVNLKLHDLADYRGKVVLLEIMQTNCPHCLEFAKIVKEAKTKYGDKLVVLSVVNPPDTQATVNRYIADLKWTTPVLFDCGQMSASYMMVTPQNPVMNVPHVFLIDQNGWIQKDFGYAGDRDVFEGRRLFSELEPLLQGTPPSTK